MIPASVLQFLPTLLVALAREPAVLAAFGRLLTTATNVTNIADRETFLETLADLLHPSLAAESAAKLVSAALDAEQVKLDASIIEGFVLAQQAEEVGKTFPDIDP